MKFEVDAQVRTSAGKGAARQLRRNGKIPAVLYGEGKSLLLAMDPSMVRMILLAQAGSTGLISVRVINGERVRQQMAVIQDYQVDPITGHLLHVDLFEVSMDKPVRVKAQIHLVGDVPIGVKEDSGVLHHIRRELHIECLPGAIPSQIEVDTSSLRIGQGIRVREVEPGEGIKLLDDPEAMIVNVSAPISEAKLAAMLGTAPAEATPVAESAAPAEGEKGKDESATPAVSKAGEGKTPKAGEGKTPKAGEGKK